MISGIDYSKGNDESCAITFVSPEYIEQLEQENQSLKRQQKEFVKYLEEEKDRLIKETSHYYIDSFDRQHAVNETVYDEVNDILTKYKEIVEVKE